jgi:hypothetical protein
MMFRMVAAVGLALCACGSASAQDKSSTPYGSAFSGGSNAGDPNGAVRALGSADSDEPRKMSVTVPKLGGPGASRTGGPPAGTTR